MAQKPTGAASERKLIREGASKAKIKSNAKAVEDSRKDLVKAGLEKLRSKPFSMPSNAHPKLNSKVSNNVKTVPSSAMKKTNAPFSETSGAKQARAENARLTAPVSKAEAKANARGLKAANKPTNKVGSKEDRALRARTKSVQMSKEEAKASYDARYGKGSGNDIVQVNRRIVPKNDARSTNHQPRIGGHGGIGIAGTRAGGDFLDQTK